MAETFTLYIDPNFNADERRTIGRTVVDYILKRTASGKGIGNVPFTTRGGSRAYSDAYQRHVNFGVAGKSPAPINLSLTGDMLAMIEVIDVSLAGKIVIGITDEENSQKARWMREKGFNFLGLSNSEQTFIMAKFAKLTPVQIAVSNIVEDVADEFLKEIASGEVN